MTFELSREELRFYDRHGYLVRRSVFNADEVAELRDAAERAVTRAAVLSEDGRTYVLDGKRFVDVGHLTIQFEHCAGSDTIRVIEPVHELDAVLDALVDDARLVEPMCDLVGAEHLALWTVKLNTKRPREGSAFRWHQDSPYWMHDCNHVDQLPNVMVAFDDATEANGCLRIVPGSHALGFLPGIDDGSQLGGLYTNPDSFDESAQVAVEVPAGSLIFFNPHIVHGSLPNGSHRPRRALVLTYQPANHPMLKSGDTRNVHTGH